MRAGGVRLNVLDRERDRIGAVGRGERVGEGLCDLVGEASFMAATGVPDRVRERPLEGDLEGEAIYGVRALYCV